MKFSFSQKIYFLIVPNLIVGLVVGTMVWMSLRIGTSEIEKEGELSRDSMLLRLHASEMSDAMKGYMLNPADSAQAARKQAADDKLVAVLKVMEGLATDPGLRGQISQLGEFDEKTLNPSENRILELIKAGKVAEAQELFNKEYSPARSEYNKLSEKLSESAHAQAKAAITAIDANMKMSANWIILVLAMSTIILTAYTTFLAMSMTRALRQAVGNLDSVGKEIMTSSHSLAEAGMQVSSGTTEAAASLEETVASIEELSSMVNLNADHAKTAAELSVTSSQSAQQGESEIQSLIDSMSEIAKSSKKIEEIINVIEDIAFQTNLLALNAAVEAARAGEQGKGFAVVADAVRNLAHRSSSAAKDITQLIHESVSKTESGSRIADRSSVVLKEIVTSIKQISNLNNEISSASTEQANGISQISTAMNVLDKATQSNAHAATLVAASSGVVSGQSTVLAGLVGGLSAFLEGRRNGGSDFSQGMNSSESMTAGGQVLSFKSKSENEKILPLEAMSSRSSKTASPPPAKNKIKALNDF